MKKFLLIIILFTTSFNIFSTEEKTKIFLKRTIAIFPVLNQNNVVKYNYLADTIRDALKSKLMENTNFLITNFSKVDNEIKKSKLALEDAIKDDKAKEISYNSRSDIAVISKFIIIEDQIMIDIEAIDVFTGQSVASSQMKGELGLDLFRIVDDITNDISEKMIQKIQKVDKTYFTEMLKTLKEKYDKIILTDLNKVGISLTSVGSCLVIAGLPVLIYDTVKYADVVRYNINYGTLNDQGYTTYYNSYCTFIGLLSGSISSMAVGIILCSVGIPLIIYKKSKKNLSFNIEFYNGFMLSFTYKF